MDVPDGYPLDIQATGFGIKIHQNADGGAWEGQPRGASTKEKSRSGFGVLPCMLSDETEGRKVGGSFTAATCCVLHYINYI